MATRMQKDYEQFVEEMGIMMEHTGIPRMAGKIFGYLLLSHKPEISTDELVERLHASRGSISTMTRLLIQQGLIDRVGRARERLDYFRVKADPWSRILKARMGQIIEFHNLIERGLEILSPKEALAYNRLREMHEYYEFMEAEFTAMLERWEHNQKQASRK